jgi:AraC-like DNA-binding protein
MVTHIRDRRLMAAMRMLARHEPGPAPRISQVGYAVGVSDERIFRRAFMRRFGFIPGDVPHRLKTGPGHGSGAPLRTWMSVCEAPAHRAAAGCRKASAG